MITKERYEMLKDALWKGADISPVDFDNMKEYENAQRQNKGTPSQGEAILQAFEKWANELIVDYEFPPCLTDAGRHYSQGKVNGLQAAKANLRRIIWEMK